jgi:hypothetical protein
MYRERNDAGRRSGTEGAVFVEFLIAFLPVLTMFLCLLQLAMLFSIRLAVGHAAVNTARAAAVVIGDEPETYGENGKTPRHDLPKARDEYTGERYETIRRAAVMSLASFIADGSINSVDVLFPPADQPGGPDPKSGASFTAINFDSFSKLRVRLEVQAVCKIAIANRIAFGGLGGILGRLGGSRLPISLMPTRKVSAEAIYPYQGARYEYPDP